MFTEWNGIGIGDWPRWIEQRGLGALMPPSVETLSASNQPKSTFAANEPIKFKVRTDPSARGVFLNVVRGGMEEGWQQVGTTFDGQLEFTRSFPAGDYVFQISTPEEGSYDYYSSMGWARVTVTASASTPMTSTTTTTPTTTTTSSSGGIRPSTSGGVVVSDPYSPVYTTQQQQPDLLNPNPVTPTTTTQEPQYTSGPLGPPVSTGTVTAPSGPVIINNPPPVYQCPTGYVRYTDNGECFPVQAPPPPPPSQPPPTQVYYPQIPAGSTPPPAGTYPVQQPVQIDTSGITSLFGAKINLLGVDVPIWALLLGLWFFKK